MNNKYIHFVGIKGVGMTALAIYCQERGFRVCGSDTSEKFQTDTLLKKYSIPVFSNFSKKNISKEINLLVYSGAYDIRKNVEIREAKRLGIPIISHGQALGKFMNEKKGISVAGTHGKTTSCALLCTVFKEAGFDPSYVIGAAGISTLPSSGHFGIGDFFIAEADEYQTAVGISKKSRFLWQKPLAALITNIDFDHPDVFEDIEEVKKAFKSFVKKIPKDGLLVYNGDDNNLSSVVKGSLCQKISFGFGRDNQYFIEKISFKNFRSQALIVTPSKKIKLSLKVPGRYNLINSCGVYALASHFKINDKLIVKTMENFSGTKRRFEKIASKDGVLYFDDYAHHPREVKETLLGVRKWYPKKRLIVVFQPHTYSRTQSLLSEFTTSFSEADLVILTEIFASRRERKDSFAISGEKLAHEVSKFHPNVYYAKTVAQVIKYLTGITKSGDLVITIGAGDIYKLHRLLR